jgi:hypothetical protein
MRRTEEQKSNRKYTKGQTLVIELSRTLTVRIEKGQTPVSDLSRTPTVSMIKG